MKRLKFLLSLCLAIFFVSNIVLTQNAGDYRSKTNGNWSVASTWETFDGSNWIDASVPPAPVISEPITITILNGHTVTTNDTVNANHSGLTIIVDGYLKETAYIRKTAGTWIVNGTYEFNRAPASGLGLPTATWNAGSTCLLTGIASATTGLNAVQDFHHLVIDCPSWSGNLNLGWGPGTTRNIYGNLVVKNTGTGRFQMHNGSAGFPGLTVNIYGNIIVDGSNSSASALASLTSNGTSTANTHITINVYGNVLVTGNPANTTWTNFSISRGSQGGSGTSIWNFYGDVSVSNAQIQNSTTTTGGGIGKFVFTKNGEQSLTFTNLNTTSAPINIEVLSGSILNIGSSTLTPSSGFFTLSSGAGIITSHASGLDGNLTNTGAKNLSTAANYTFAGTSAQLTGVLMPTSVNNLTINNNVGVTLSQSTTVNGTLYLIDGVLYPDANNLVVTGNISGGSNSSYVDGKMSLVYNSTGSKYFPIGKSGNYRPINLNFTQLTGTSTVTAEQFETPLTGTIPPSVNLFVDRYWTLTESGGSDYLYDITFDGTGFTPQGPPVVLKKDGEIINIHNAGEPLFTATGLSSFSDFALGAIKTFTITATAGPNGSINPSGDVVVVYGSDKTFYITPDPNYMIDDVIVDGSSVGAVSEYTFTNVTDNHTIHAQFRILSYPLNVTIVGNGNVIKDPDLPLYNHGAQVTLTAIPQTGWTFAGWSGDVVSTDNPITVTMTSEKNITATFTINQYPLNVSIVGNGSVIKDPDLPLYNHGTLVTLTAVPQEGWSFDGWDGDVFSTDNPIVVTMDEAKDIIANFSINEYTLHITIDGEGDVTIVPDLPFYEHGTEVTLTAIPDLGWLFKDWSGDVSSTDNPITITMNSNKNITATFTKIVSAKYRTFLPESLVALDAKGKIPKAVKRKPISAYWEFALVNNTGSEQNELNIQFKNDVNFARGITALPFTNVSGDTKKKFKFTGATVQPGDTVIVKGYSTKGKEQQIKKAFFGATEPKPNPAVNLNPVFQRMEFPLPTYANLIEEIYKAVPTGMVIGKVRTDSANFYGWVNLNKPASIQKSLYDKKAEEGVHSGEPRYFDEFSNGKKFVKEQKSLPPTKHDNALFAEIVALKLAILASATGHTEDGGGFGELEYVGSMIRFYGKSISEIAETISEAMTIYTGNDLDYFEFYDLLRSINEAFSGPIDTISFVAGNKTVLKGVADLEEIDFLIENPSRTKVKIVSNSNYNFDVPSTFTLAQNYPNPFNPTTTIEFTLPEDAIVSLKVYNILGQEVATLADKELFNAGLNEVEFDATNLPSGVYFYRITAEVVGDQSQKFTQVKKMVLLK